MKERPILFSGEMVRAILDGQKTMTRRVIKPNPDKAVYDEIIGGGTGRGGFTHTKIIRWNRIEFSVFGEWKEDMSQLMQYCPYGKPGDRLWVRETWFPTANPFDKEPATYRVSATNIAKQIIESGSGWRPSIFMPRWASRITLEVTAVRVERLQDITWSDARYEGIHREDDASGYQWYKNYGPGDSMFKSNPVKSFETLWDSINSKRGHSWESNPWVWVIEFKRV